eukprot:TRINITY_DN3429_c1_g1_i4.p1 TRINITY_DN3429_c1_g1~~TRINITY_DN3429_c1_g1_i4.p1  ORF type:complete len:585 (+),score=128.39 TRINITY_DN3429_c1_g1_i4:148-1902(+)
MFGRTTTNQRLANNKRTNYIQVPSVILHFKTKKVVRVVYRSYESSYFNNPTPTSTLTPNPALTLTPHRQSQYNNCRQRRGGLSCKVFKGFKINLSGNLGGGAKPPLPTLSTRDAAIILLNLAALLYSGNVGTTKDVILRGFTPSLVVSLKFVVGGLVLLPLLLKQKPQIQPSFPKFHEWMALGELGMWLGLGTCAQAMELLTSTSTEGSVMLALYLVMVPVLEVLSGNAISNVQIMSVVGSIFGVGLMNLNSSSGFDFDMGLVWGLLSSLCFALHLFRSERLSKEVQMDAMMLGVGQLIVAGLVSGAAALGQDGASEMASQGIQILNGMKELAPWGFSMLGCAVVFSAIPQTIELAAISHVPASQASLILTMIVIWGALQGILLRGEQIDSFGSAGALIIIASALFPQLLPNLKLSWPSFGPYKNAAQGDNANILMQAYCSTQDDLKDLQDLTLLSPATEFKLPSPDFVNNTVQNDDTFLTHACSNENLQELALLAPIVQQDFLDGNVAIEDKSDVSISDMQVMEDMSLLNAPLEFALATSDGDGGEEDVLILTDDAKNFDLVDQLGDENVLIEEMDAVEVLRV